MSNGDLVNEEKTLEEIMDEEEKQITILAFEYEKEDEDIIEKLKQSKDIICPICKEICLLNFNDYKINFGNCKKKEFFRH